MLGINALCVYEIMNEKTFLSLLARTFSIILFMIFQSATGLRFETLYRFDTFGINTIAISFNPSRR